MCLHKDLYILSSIVHESQKVETTHPSLSWWMDTENAVHSDDGLLLSSKRNGILIPTTTWMNLTRIVLTGRSQMQKTTYQSAHIGWPGNTDLDKQEVAAWGREWGRERTGGGHEGSLWGDNSVVRLDGANGCTTLKLTKKSLDYTLWVNFMICVNKTVLFFFFLN